VQRRYRLTSSQDIQRVRRSGQSYAHPFVVLVIQEGYTTETRFALIAGTSVGNAVERNRAKRLLRAALQNLIAEIKPGFDAVLIARQPLIESNCNEISQILHDLFVQAELSEVN
jgi:ribonuclease P protein component